MTKKNKNETVGKSELNCFVMLPDTLFELYDAVKSMGNPVFCFDTEDEMDNVQSMDYFLSGIQDLKDENIAIHDGTQVYLKSWAWDKEITLNSGGRGDFRSHKVTAEWAT